MIAAARRCADVNALDAKTGEAALHVVGAVSYKRLNLARDLVSRGADINIRALRTLVSPLHCAAAFRRLDLVCYLLERGADVDALDADGRLPIYYAFFPFNVENRPIALALIEAGSRVDCISKRGWSPLHEAAERCDTPLLKLLLERGAITEYRNGGERALDVALRHGFTTGVEGWAPFYDMALRRRNVIARRRLKLEWSREADEQDGLLYHDLLRVFDHVTCRRDWAQLRLVCKRWRAAADETLPQRPLAFFEYRE